MNGPKSVLTAWPVFATAGGTQDTVETIEALSGLGWVIMLTSIAFVVGLALFCFYTLLTAPPAAEEHVHRPLEIDTQDRGT